MKNILDRIEVFLKRTVGRLNDGFYTFAERVFDFTDRYPNISFTLWIGFILFCVYVFICSVWGAK